MEKSIRTRTRPVSRTEFGKAIARLELLEQQVNKTGAAAVSVIAPAKPIEILGSAIIMPLQAVMLKIAANGERLPDTAKEHVAVLLPDYGLLIDARAPAKAENHKHALQLGAAVDLFGFKDWQLWSEGEACKVVCRDLNPAYDKNFFPHTPTDRWYLTRTDYAPNPSGYAVGVSFGLGGVNGINRSYDGFARACRRVAAGQA